MSKKNKIGLDASKCEQLAIGLNKLLATYQIYYMNLRGFHWNISGEKFFELHLKFEELYNDSLVRIDEVAERILTLGHQPDDTFSNYFKISSIKETSKVSDGKTAMKHVVNSLQALIEIERELLVLSSKANDEGTNALMSDYIRMQEKLVWMFTSYLGNKK